MTESEYEDAEGGAGGRELNASDLSHQIKANPTKSNQIKPKMYGGGGGKGCRENYE